MVALFGIAANRPQEALYIIGVTDPSHAYLDGARDYVIHFAAGQSASGPVLLVADDV